jgi:SAM-dependent methyltransferase
MISKKVSLKLSSIAKRMVSLVYSAWDEISIALTFPFKKNLNGTALNYSTYRKLLLPSWYHDFSTIGIPTSFFRAGGYNLSQEDKEPILFPLIDQACQLVKAKTTSAHSTINLIDLFCADAYYSIYALHNNLVQSAVGVDYEESSGEGFLRGGVLNQAEMISTLCGVRDRLVLKNGNVMTYEGKFDICLCFGGLYHIESPEELLARISDQTRHALVIQTVIPSNVDESEPFFISPAPNWTWGCRFNQKYLIQVLEKLGWEIVKTDLRPLRYNEHDWDKLSLSVLCIKPT